MAKVTFYPIGNADSILVDFSDERTLLVDYCNRRNPKDKNDKRVVLADELRSALAERDEDGFDFVAFTHADDDHVGACEDFFWFDHAELYQGKDRIRIRTLWVPACLILESGLTGSARVLRQEARYRLKEGENIRVFGNPGALDEWLVGEGIDPDERGHLITHAGECVPGLTGESGGVEVFVHSPFSFRMEGEEVDRNDASLVLHLTFFEGDSVSRVMLGGDAEYAAWEAIVWKTERKSRTDRLQWDGFKIAHHCSHDALSPEKGRGKTEPKELVDKLFRMGEPGCFLVSSSDPIPDESTKLPPHKQAAEYYREIAADNFLVTMEYPSQRAPRPLIVKVTGRGLAVEKGSAPAVVGASVVSRPSPRLG